MKKKNIVLGILVILFLLLAILVKRDGSFAIDSAVYKFIIGFRNDSLTNFFKLFTKLGTVKICLLVEFILILIFRNKIYIVFPFTTIFIKGLNLFTKLIVDRERPNILRLVAEKETSFPSGHAMLSITFFGLLIYFIYSKISKNSVKWILIILLSFIIILIGVSRIYLGVHYFTDIIGGYILGLIYLLIITNYIKLRDD